MKRLSLVFILMALALPPQIAAAATRVPCSAESFVGPSMVGDPVNVLFRNDMPYAVTISWIDGSLHRHNFASIEPDKQVKATARVGTAVIATDSRGKRVAIYHARGVGEDLIDISPDAIEYQNLDPALELFARAVQCPVDVRTIPDPFTDANSSLWVESRQARFLGSASRFVLLLHKQQFDTSLSSGAALFRTLRETIEADMKDIGGITQVNAVVTIPCLGGTTCLSDDIVANPTRPACEVNDACQSDPTKGWYRSESVTFPRRINLRFCDESAAVDATVALKSILQQGK